MTPDEMIDEFDHAGEIAARAMDLMIETMRHPETDAMSLNVETDEDGSIICTTGDTDPSGVGIVKTMTAIISAIAKRVHSLDGAEAIVMAAIRYAHYVADTHNAGTVCNADKEYSSKKPENDDIAGSDPSLWE